MRSGRWRSIARRHGAVVTLVAAALAASVTSVPSAGAATVPSWRNHFALGVAAQPDDRGLDGWMPQSGIPWDFAYQYLAGGVNTGTGWTTWNENATFPLRYANSARARGYVPVFSYYQLQQSHGPCDGCGEAARDLANLDSPSTMREYFADFTMLMQRLGPNSIDGITGFGGEAIVHVEPDLSGFAQQAVLDNTRCFGHCSAQGNDPSLLRAAVGSSGAPGVGGFANTYAGFSAALAHLRDLYAPNVTLAFHVSTWAPLIDVGTSRDTTVDATALGAKAGAFAASAMGGYDFVFNDVADRDAGYYKYVLNDDRFWDRDNVRLPNFHRWEQYISAVSDVTGRKVLVWQIPLGNQYFTTENNTAGHYQDNRVEYFLSHVPELIDAGIVGLLFGAGNAGSTVNYDGARDGVTNPPTVCTDDGSSSGPICPSQQSSVADDDGGYLRTAAANYYRDPYELNGRCDSVPAVRVAGADRVATSIATSQLGFPNGAGAVVIASAVTFPDALASTPLARRLDAPVLLVADRWTAELQGELDRLDPDQAVIIGGTRAIPPAVDGSVAAQGARVRRVAGDDRYATAAAIAREHDAATGEVVIVNGESFADALAAGPFAAGVSAPILLVRRSEIPPATAAALEQLDIRSSVAVGGSTAIDEAVLRSLPGATRVAGTDRYSTATAVAQRGRERGLLFDTIWLATGTTFPDALGGGATVALARGVLLLVDARATAASTFLDDAKVTSERVVVFGGTQAVGDDAVNRVACSVSAG